MMVVGIVGVVGISFVLTCICISSSKSKDTQEEDRAQEEFVSNYLRKKTANRV